MKWSDTREIGKALFDFTQTLTLKRYALLICISGFVI